jgi:hypothetical protein
MDEKSPSAHLKWAAIVPHKSYLKALLGSTSVAWRFPDLVSADGFCPACSHRAFALPEH